MSLARLAALRAEEPGDGNPEQVEQDHRHGGVATNFPKDKFKVSEVLDHLNRTTV